MADDANLMLSKYGEYLYKNLIVFAPMVLEFGGQMDTEAITKFIDDGGNLLMAGNAAAGDVYREIASECGFEVIVFHQYLIYAVLLYPSVPLLLFGYSIAVQHFCSIDCTNK